MGKLLIVNGRPFAGKRIYAKKIVETFDDYAMVPLIKGPEPTKDMSLYQYFSFYEQCYVGSSRISILNLFDDGKNAVITCNNEAAKQLIDYCEEWGHEARCVFINAEMQLSLTRYLSCHKTDVLDIERAESLAEDIVNLVHQDQLSRHNIAYDQVVNAKKIEKAGVKKIPKLFETNHTCTEITRRQSDFSNSAHMIGLKSLIFNQLKAYGMISDITIERLVKAICRCIDSYNSRSEEG